MFFTTEKLERQLREIRAAIHREVRNIPEWKFFAGDCRGAERADLDDRAWENFQVGGYWGGYDKVAWFRTRVPIPREWRGRKIALRFLVGPRDGGKSTAETMLYVDGVPLQAIDIWHEEAWLPPEFLQDGEITVALRAWSGTIGVPERRHFKVAELIWTDEATECFFYLADTVLNTVKVLDENDLRRLELLAALNDSFHLVQFLQPGSEEFYASLVEAEKFLENRLAKLETPERKPTVVGIGHAHLDMAWLWRLSHTREKGARTFATALHMLRQYPDYRFMHSSPQLYKYLQTDQPEIYRKVKERIAAGQWEITGGMWVEADTNIPNGESLVRQILFGKRLMRKEFGVESHVLWMPDVFGYSDALPQIMQKSGLDYFVTTKISWSQFNRFPSDTFRWRGIDGSEVLTHFVTTPEEGGHSYTYNGMMTPYQAKGIWDVYKQKDINDELLLIFGWGDGGGGPTKEMIESARAMKNLPGLPRVEMDTVEHYCARLGERLKNKDVPVWDGELYLEYHRGTYTSQARNKRANRQAEILFHDAEAFSAMADVLTHQSNYPQNELNRAWELILVNQFHDILPGSSIRQVYEDCAKDYATIQGIGRQAASQATNTLVGSIAISQPSIVVFNSLAWRRDDLVAVPWSEELRGAGQTVEENGERKVLILAHDVPAIGYRTLPLEPVTGDRRPGTGHSSPVNGQQSIDPALRSGAAVGGRRSAVGGQRSAVANPMVVTPTLMENDFYRIALNAQGQITSLFDKTNQREVLAPNARVNVLQAFEDKPMQFDAWDIDIYYQEKMSEIGELLGATVEETGPLRGVLRLQWHFHHSLITQRVTIYRDSRRIDFRTEVDWHEHQVLLKTAFPVDIRSTRATYDIQFGNVERPTHWNTSWDWARFEVAAHKWADLSEGNYGVALLNDCKYGYDIKNNVMRLTLLKSGIEPDETADQGKHEFTYSLLPHAGDWREGNVAHAAYALNYPLRAVVAAPNPNGDLPERCEFVSADAGNVMIETIKKAEDDDSAWIVRVYEYKQFRQRAVHLTFAQPIRRAVECDLIEDGAAPIEFEDQRLTFPITPYEIKTFKVWF